MKDRTFFGVNIENCKYKYNTSNGCGIKEGGNGTHACEYATDCYYKQLVKTKAQYEAVVNQNRELQAELQPFRQEYFKSLNTFVIAELAKSQLKTTAQNIKAEDLIEYIYKTTVNAGAENAVRIIRQAIEKYRGKNER